MTLQERMDKAKHEFQEAKDKLEQVNTLKTQVEQRMHELRGQYQVLEQIMREMTETKKEEPTNV